MISATTVWTTMKAAAGDFLKHNATTLAASIAYYTALSLAPMLLLVIALAGAVFGQKAASGEVERQLTDLIGQEEAKTVQDMVQNSDPAKKGGGWVAGAIGIVTLGIGAMTVFGQLQFALNTVWDVPVQTASGYWQMIKDRLLSFSMVGGMAFLLIVSSVLSAVLGAFDHQLHQWLPGAEAALRVVNVLVTAVVPFLMFAMIFKILPRVKLAWGDVWIGAAITTLLFAVGKFLIGFYLGKAAPGSTFGAAGSFVVLLVWLYYSAAILLFGAEFTHTYAIQHGSTQRHDGANRDKTDGKSGPVPAGAATGK